MLVIGAALAVSALGGYAQGYVEFSAAAGTVWDDFTTANVGAKSKGTVDAVFLWTTSSSLVSSWSISATATNAASSSTTWSAIESAITAGWNVGTSEASNAVVVDATQNSIPLAGNLLGAIGQYTNVPTSGTFSAVIVAWNSSAGTWSAAEGTAADLGVSGIFSVTPASSSTGTLAPFTSSPNTLTPFGVAGAVPEPSTIALAGLGVSALVAFRRRNASK